jgi:hypothetical protein
MGPYNNKYYQIKQYLQKQIKPNVCSKNTSENGPHKVRKDFNIRYYIYDIFSHIFRRLALFILKKVNILTLNL